MTNDIPARCRDCVVRDSALCAALADDELQALSDIGRRKVVAKGAVLTWNGEDDALCASVVSGALKLFKGTADGREQAVGLVFAGDFVGQPFANTGELTAVALSDTDLCLYPRGRFEAVLSDRPRLQRALLERTMRSLDDARERQLTLGRRSAGARVATMLLDLATVSGRDEVELPMSRGDMADYLGLTIETVSRQLADLRSLGLVEVARGSRTVQIRDREALRARADD